MNVTLKNIVASLATAAVIGNCAFLFQVNARLATVEAQLKFLTETHLAKN